CFFPQPNHLRIATQMWTQRMHGVELSTLSTPILSLAQGMSDVLRCPVCSCAHFLCTLRMGPRVQRAPGIPCALCFREGGKFLANLGCNAPRERSRTFSVIARFNRAPSIP